MPSFDVVSEVDMQEVRNAVDQAAREIANRFDFKNTNSSVELGEDEIKMASVSEDRLIALRQVLEEKFAKRKVSMKVLDYSEVEQASGNTVRQSASLVQGISAEKAKELNKAIKALGVKGIQSSTQGDQLRVTGKKRDALQEVIAALKRDGLYENTVIFMFSDHGMKLHRHKQLLYEGGIQMPLVVAGKGMPAGKVRNDLVSGIDVSAASLAVSGIGVPKEMEGRNFMAANYQPRKFVVSARDRCDYTIEKIRAVVTPRFKYLRNYLTDRPYMQPTYKDPWDVTKKFRAMMANGEMNETQLLFFGDNRVPEELYDLENDPHEINNLADDPAFAKQLKEHRQLLANWIEKTGDKGQAPESEVGLLCTLKRWGDKRVNTEYDRVRPLLAK